MGGFVLRTLQAVVVAVLVLVVGCKSGPPPDSRTKTADRFYALLKAQDYDGILRVCSPAFLKETPGNEFVEGLKRAQGEFGTLERYILRSEKSTHYSSPNEEGTRTVLQFACAYQRAETNETLTIDEATNGKDPAVVAYDVSVKPASD
jgi:hypothetical protein